MSMLEQQSNGMGKKTEEEKKDYLDSCHARVTKKKETNASALYMQCSAKQFQLSLMTD